MLSRICIIVLGYILAISICIFSDAERSIPIEGSPFVGIMEERNVSVVRLTHQKESSLLVRFYPADWPNIFFRAEHAPWDWSEYYWLVLDIKNPEKTDTRAYVRIDNEGADGTHHCITAGFTLPAKQRTTIPILLPNPQYPYQTPADPDRSEVYSKHPLWGMRRAPGNFVEAKGIDFDLSKIVGFQLFLSSPKKDTALELYTIRLDKQIALPNFLLPFVDPLGQYKHANWKGKTHSEEEMIRNAQQELKCIRSGKERDRQFDSYGGWTKGPRLAGTGWFRTECIDGFWWLVTPEGNVFLSLGVNCVGMFDMTFITNRENWFEYIPDRDDPMFKSCFASVNKEGHWFNHIIGDGLLFSFHRANMIRQYGDKWEPVWCESTLSRLRRWGFNTIGAWSAIHLFQDKKIPFVVILGIGNAPRIKNAPGYWGPFYDVFDPQFEEMVHKYIGKGVEPFKNNPYCMGYFVDNELSWDGIWEGTLNDTTGQPCKQELIQFCKQRYGTLEQLNQSWNSSFANWDELSKPSEETEYYQRDRNDFLIHCADKYFSVIAQAVKKYAPNQLYLGCRFAGFPHESIWITAQQYVDVMSINMYRRKFNRDHPLLQKTDKPIMIGEFHFGATDRGMFHPGLIPCKDQTDRAKHYEDYVRQVAIHPLFVGCHWFQWADQPITGRYFDGENYNIGLVDITNKPYPELTRTAEKINKKAYSIRWKESQRHKTSKTTALITSSTLQ